MRRPLLSALRRLRGRSHTALILPVPSVDGLVEDSARDRGMPAHITLLYPFLPTRSIDRQLERDLHGVLAGVGAFEFALAEIGCFPGVVYLAPEPAARFVALTSALVARWPDHPPYGGAYEDIVPHLTVAYGDLVPAGLAQRLPVAERADEVWLMARAARRWARVARVSLA